MNILITFYGNNVCKICKHYVLDIPTSKIPAHIEKMALPTSKSVGDIGFNLYFHMIFFYWILVAVIPNFNCLMQCCSVSYSVTLVQIEQKLRKLQPVQYVLRDKIARDSFIMKFLRIFFHFVHNIFF